MLRFAKICALSSRNSLKSLDVQTRCVAAQAARKAHEENVPEANPTTKPEVTSFVRNLYCGRIELDQIFPFPEPLTDDQLDTVKMLLDPLEKFYKEINDPMKNDTNASIDEKISKALWELGAFSLQVPQEYGGLGLCNTQYTRCVEICGYHDLGVAITLGAHQSIGFKGILLFGTPEQKAKYLPKVCNGTYAAFCLTEPSCGSDAQSIRCRAIKSADGSHYVLNGSKIWISNGGIADIMTVFAQTPMENPKTGKVEDRITAFIVERSFGGVTSGPPEEKMGIKCSNTAEIFFEDVKIPAENVLGEEGKGFKIAMNILNNGRFGMAAAMSDKLGRMGMLQYVTESLAYMICGLMDNGSDDYHTEAAISKCFASESAWWVCDEAIQILGGMGYMKSCGLERVMRDLRIFRIFEGTNDILRLLVAGSGFQTLSVQMMQLQKSVQKKEVDVLLGEAKKRLIRFTGLSLRNSSFGRNVHPSLMASSDLCSKQLHSFAAAADKCAWRYKKALVDQQFVLHKMAQATIDIYTMMVVLSRATLSANKCLPTAEHEVLMANTWCLEASKRAEMNIDMAINKKYDPLYANLRKISSNLCVADGCVQSSPLEF
ncbi:hypothetical protein KM043_014241 [Ampulex compressa]|nr:hypothetical protein KM043_014241 [Ampulex compressa]